MKIKNIVEKLSLEEKAGLCSGKDFWTTKEIPHVGIGSVMLSDGPVGLRKQKGNPDHLGLNESIKAICFPSACLTACSFDRSLMEQLGETLGDECLAEDVAVILGPSMNIKRSPLCGRNFEYISEDPYLTGELATTYIKGVQSRNIGTSVKHFAANSQEKNRTTTSSNVDERTLREIYLSAFEKAVKEASPWSVMASYNKINGVYASENEWLLNEVLRKEWGFEGFVVSDWNAVVHRVAGLTAGMDLEMPGNDGRTDKKIIEAVTTGELDEEILNQAVSRIIEAILRYQENTGEQYIFDYERDHERATEIARKSMVLLKNNGVLPLDKKQKIAFVGEFAKHPRFQGGGSANVNAYRVEGAIDCVNDLNVVYAQGFSAQGSEKQEELFNEAVETAAKADVAVVFIGLPDTYESEGYDRTHLDIPQVQNDLVSAICKKQKKVVVVLHNGAPVLMPWLNQVSAVLESYLGGEAVGKAQVDILFGDANPAGKLAETFPMHLAHNPSYTNFAEKCKEVNYKEGIFVGYRWYDSRNIDVLFPFGFGLSYTSFTYRNMKLSRREMTDDDIVKVSVDVTNSGETAGDEIVQLYIGDNTNVIVRPEKELKGFERVHLASGETKTVTMELDRRSFAYYSELIHDWYCSGGEYIIKIGKSSRDIVLEESITFIQEKPLPIMIDEDTVLGEILGQPEARALIMDLMEPFFKEFGMSQDEMGEAILSGLPLRGMQGFAGVSDEKLEEIIQQLKVMFDNEAGGRKKND